MAVSLDGTFRIIDRASRPMAAMERQAKRTDLAINKLGADLDKVGSSKHLQQLERTERAVREVGNAAEVAQTRTRNMTRAAEQNSRAMNRQAGSAKKASGEFGGLERIARKLILTLAGLKILATPLMLGGLIVGALHAASAIGALLAGVVSLIPQVVNLSGAAGALPATFIGLGLAMVTVKLATQDLGKALGGNKNALKSLTPEGRRFVETLKAMQPLLKEARQSAQRGLFPGLERAMDRLRVAAPMVNRLLETMGRRLGTLASRAASRLTAAGFLRDLEKLGNQGGRIVSTLGEAVMDLVDALRHVAVAAIPFTDWLRKSIGRWAEYLRHTMMVKRETGDLRRFFDRTRVSMIRWGHIIRDVSIGIANIVRMSRGLGRGLAKSFEEGAGSFRQWTEQLTNRAKMRAWFDSARDTLGAMGRLIGGILQMFGRLFGTQGQGGTAALIDKITASIPTVERFLRYMGEEFGPPFLRLVEQIVKLFTRLADDGGGPIVRVMNLLSRILDFVDRLVERFPVLGEVITNALTVGAFVWILSKLKLVSLAWGLVTWNAKRAAAAQAAALGAPTLIPGGGGPKGGPGVPVPLPGGPKGGPRGGPNAPKGPGRTSRLLSMGGNALAFASKRFWPLAAAWGGYNALSYGGYQGSTGERALQATSAVASAIDPFDVIPGPDNFRPFARSGTQPIEQLIPGDSYATPAGQSAGQLRSMRWDINDLGLGITGQEKAQEKALRAGDTEGAAIYAERAAHLREERDYRQTIYDLAVKTATTDWEAWKKEQDAAKVRRERTKKAEERLKGQKLLGSLGAGYDAILALAQQTPNKGGAGGRKVANEALLAQLNEQLPGMNEQQTLGLGRGLTTWVQQQKTAFLKSDEAAKMTPARKKAVLDSYDDIKDRIVKKYENLGIAANKSTGKIRRDQVREWRGVQAAVLSPAQQMLAGVSAAFTGMEDEVVRRLVSIGYSGAAARSIVSTGQIGNPNIESGMNMQGLITPESQRTPAAATSSGQNDLNLPTNAAGGRIPGYGFYDTVPVIPAIAAPGELVVNRHTERRVDGLLSMLGTSLDREVHREKRPHYAPPSSSGGGAGAFAGILPGLDVGGRIPGGHAIIEGDVGGGRTNAAGAPQAHGAADLISRVVTEANRIDALRSPYVFGGGHGTPAPPNGPFDCSSSVSRVLQAAGLPIPTMVSGAFLNWGEPGLGALSVAVRPGEGGAGHVYLIVNGKAWGTSPENPGGGPGWISGYVTRPGFTYRHLGDVGNIDWSTLGVAGIGGTSVPIPEFPDLVAPNSKLPGAYGAAETTMNKRMAAALTAKVRDAMQAAGAPGGGGTGATDGSVASWIQAGMSAAGVSGDSWFQMLSRQVQRESGGNPRAINNWDSNAAAGTPSMGLLQTIQSTFNAHAIPGLGDIYNPVANVAAAIRYMVSRYGHGDATAALAAMWARGGQGYSTGGRLPDEAIMMAARAGAAAGAQKSKGDVTVNVNVKVDAGSASDPAAVGRQVAAEVSHAFRALAHEIGMSTSDDGILR